MAMKNHRSCWEGSSSLEAAEVATAYASPEARWLADMLGGSDDLVSGWGKRSITISYT